MSTVRLDEARKRRAYREHLRKADKELIKPSANAIKARDEYYSKSKKISNELSDYCTDVDKDIALYDTALFDACKTILSKELACEESEVPLTSISILMGGYFGAAYAVAPEHLQPTQIAPDLTLNEPAFKDEANAKQLNVLNAIDEAVKEKENEDSKKTKLVVAPDQPTCIICGAQLANFSETLGHKVYSFSCGAVREVHVLDNAEISRQLAACPRLTDGTVTGLIGMLPEDAEVVDEEPDLPEPCCTDAMIQSGVDVEAAQEQLGDDLQAAAKELCKSVAEQDTKLLKQMSTIALAPDSIGIEEVLVNPLTGETALAIDGDLLEAAEAFINSGEVPVEESPKSLSGAGSVEASSEASTASADSATSGADKPKSTRKRNSKKDQ